MQHSEETAAAVAKAIEQVTEGFNRKLRQATEDLALRKWCVEQSMKGAITNNVEPAAAARNLYRFIIEPFKEVQP